MSNVQFDDDSNFERKKFAMQSGGGSGSIPRVSSDTRLLLSIVIALSMGATLFIWLKYMNKSHPVIDDSNLTPYSGLRLK